MWVQSLDLKDPLEEKWQPTAVFLPEKSHGQRSLVGYSPWSRKEPARHNWATQHTHTHTHTHSDLIVVFVQLLSHVRLCDSMDSSTPGFPALHHLPELAQTHVHWVGDAIQPSHPLSSPSAPAFDLSQHQGFFQWVSCLHHVAKVLELQHQPFRVDFFLDWLVLAVQGTLKSLLQHHNSKASILQCSTFFKIQLLYPYMTTRKTIAFSRQTFVSVVMSPLFNTLSKCFPDSSVAKESSCNAGDSNLIPGSGRFAGEWMDYPLQYSWASLVAQL